MDNEQLFNRAMALIRRGESGIAVVDTLEDEFGGDLLELRKIASEAESYARELQDQAFVAAVEAFRRGETRLEVERKLREVGFHSWDAGLVAGRAQAKAAEPAANVM